MPRRSAAALRMNTRRLLKICVEKVKSAMSMAIVRASIKDSVTNTESSVIVSSRSAACGEPEISCGVGVDMSGGRLDVQST